MFSPFFLSSPRNYCQRTLARSCLQQGSRGGRDSCHEVASYAHWTSAIWKNKFEEVFEKTKVR